MKLPRLRTVLTLATFIAPVLAHAHPGHDGDHELTWDVDHFVRHPFATLACVSLVAVAGWIVWRLLKSFAQWAEKPVSRRR